MKIKNIIIPVVAISLVWACESSNSQFKLKKGDRVFLQEFPDSAYVANLDSILKAENVLDIAPKEQKQFTMTLADLKVASAKKKTVQGAPKATNSIKVFSKEEFAKIFLASMDEVKKGSKGIFVVKVKKEGEKIEGLMKRAYKTKAVSGVPKVMLKFGLSSLNPGIDLDELKIGQSIKLPVIK